MSNQNRAATSTISYLSAITITLFGWILPGQTQSNSIVVSDNSQNTAANLLVQGQAKSQQQNYQGAIADLSKAILLDPNQPETYFQRGLIRSRLEDNLGALLDFDDAILLNPRHAQAYFHRGGLHLTGGNQSQGILDLQQAARLFSQQGNKAGYQKTLSLLQHFGINLDNT